MNAQTVAQLKKSMAEANAAMARYINALEKKRANAKLEMDARCALATLAACIETEGVF